MNLKSIRLFLLIAVKYVKRNKVWFLGGAGAFIILVLLLLQLRLFSSQNTLRLGLIGTYQEHDLPAEVTKLLSTGLVEASSEGRIKPKLVSGWEINNDATRFNLN